MNSSNKNMSINNYIKNTSSSSLKGIYFGLTEGTVTILGIIIGMYGSAPMKIAIIGAVVAASISDSLGDGIGMYYSEKAKIPKEDTNKILKTIAGLVITKIIVSFLYLVPIVLFTNLETGILVTIFMASLLILGSLFFLQKQTREEKKTFYTKNITIIIVVILISYLAGKGINKIFESKDSELIHL